MKLSEIKKSIHEMGVTRIKYELPNRETAVNYFKAILNEMLIRKNETLQWDPISKEVEFMIDWTYMEGKGIDYNKGFLFKGLTGRGKTFLFRAWKYFLSVDNVRYKQDGRTIALNPPIVNVKKIAGEYQHPQDGGYRVIEKYGYMNCLILDDIGKEDEFSQNYGNKVNIIEEIINLREDTGLLTFGTTNENTLSKTYDDRTVSRMNKLFTPVPVNHKTDFRKK